MTDGARSLHYLTRSRSKRASVTNRFREARIRALSLSIVAVAAIAASLLLTKSRDEHDDTGVVPGEQQSARLQLDAIRAAGL
jgi:anti-sigma-K factor RskA